MDSFNVRVGWSLSSVLGTDERLTPSGCCFN